MAKLAVEQIGAVVRISLYCDDDQEADQLRHEIVSQFLDGKKITLERFGDDDDQGATNALDA